MPVRRTLPVFSWARRHCRGAPPEHSQHGTDQKGVWPVHELIRTLQDNNWPGPWGIEILSETYRMRPLEEALPEVVRCSLNQFELANKR